MLIDTHVHVGQFYKEYFAPSMVSQLMEQCCVDYYAVSSTTQCEENYPKVIEEFEELIRLDGDKILPVLWITPESLQGNIAWYLESSIKWRMLKIHPFLNQEEWNPKSPLLNEVFDIARELHLPLLIHTGNEASCKAQLYEAAVKSNPDIIFILAHGRPLKSALCMGVDCKNVYIDSAFMPIEHMKEFIDKGLSYKLLWGTDMCIPKHFDSEINLKHYYLSKLQLFREICTPEQYEQVAFENANRLFLIR